MSKKQAALAGAALAGAAVDKVSGELAKKHIEGFFTDFRAEGRHIFGTTVDGDEVKVTAMANGGEGLKSKELATEVAARLNSHEQLANLMGLALQIDFNSEGFSVHRIPKRETEDELS